MLKLIHYNHLGIEKSKNRARKVMFWPSMSKDITNLINNCIICLKHKKCNMKETMINREVPNGPWQTLGIDIFFYKNSNYFLIVNYFSKFVEINKIDSITSYSVVAALKSQFARHGIPYLVYSDTGTQLTSKEIQKFTQEWNFELRTSSAKYSQSNGMVKRHIGIIKKNA